jgi:hypothetical protein
MISEKRLEEAMRMLATTDETSAELKTNMLRKEYVMDLARRRCFLIHEGNIEERKAKAETDNSVTLAAEVYYEAVGAYEKLKAQRATEELIVEVWRSLNANRRAGNI